MRKLLFLAMLFASATIFAQGTVTGKVMDSEMDGPLPGANVKVVGTNNGTMTDFDGNFSLNVKEASGSIQISFVGYETKTVKFNIQGETADLGEIVVAPAAGALDEIVITTYSLAIDRKTPVAVSTIKTEDIELRLSNKEFPEILQTTPGIYAHKQGGGFGDAELRLRGFDSENVAVMINGVPVNDMENGRVYWSNWAGLSDVTRTMQVQRGLGASKVAVPSIGGTINIVTKSTDAEKGGNVFTSTGNDGYLKVGGTVSTGKLDNDFAATVSLSRTSGNGFVDGTEFTGYSYFVNFAKEINEDHELSFTAFGAPQEHGQRQNAHNINVYRESERGIRFNGDWGYRNGKVTHIQDNFYHKPQMSLNHYWTMSDKSKLSTAVYASFGTGGGGGFDGAADLESVDSEYRSGYLQPFDLDQVVNENVENGALGSETILYNSRNDHNWYGALSTFTTEITEDINLLAGVDLRYYKGKHFQEVKDLLGGSYWLDEGSDENNPANVARVGDKINYYNDGLVHWEGGFLQAEYSKNDLSAFISGAISNTSYKRVDYFNYLDSDPQQETDWVSFVAPSIKGGANYNLDDNHNVFANIGFFERAPFFGTVFQNYQNIVNDDAKNQKIFSYELGYGFRSEKLRANVNLYRTQWNDKPFTQRFFDRDTQENYFANILGVNALHQGIEIDFSYKPFEELTINGMASIGDWKWDSNVTDVRIFDDEQNPVGDPIDLYLDEIPVGGAAQNTFALGANYQVIESTNVRVNWTYADNLYSQFDPLGVSSENDYMPWELPAYGLVDLGLTHRMDIGGLTATLNGNVNNLLDTEYVSFAFDGDESNAQTSDVWYGFGRTYTVGLKVNF